MRRLTFAMLVVLLAGIDAASAQTPQPPPARPPATAAPSAPAATPADPVIPAGVKAPSDYVIGADDQLSIIFWREKEMSAEVSVRPDGKISLPLLNDIQAAGLTPEQLRLSLNEAAAKFIEEPTVTVVVRAINSRRVFVTGQVGKPGPYPLTAPTTVLQLLALAGGVAEYAKSEDIQVMRTENGKTTNYRFNYKDVTKGKQLTQNILLKPGDTVIVP
jgi:polysaccharide export outer membrane protein